MSPRLRMALLEYSFCLKISHGFILMCLKTNYRLYVTVQHRFFIQNQCFDFCSRSGLPGRSVLPAPWQRRGCGPYGGTVLKLKMPPKWHGASFGFNLWSHWWLVQIPALNAMPWDLCSCEFWFSLNGRWNTLCFLDKVVQTMFATGRDMSHIYKRQPWVGWPSICGLLIRSGPHPNLSDHNIKLCIEWISGARVGVKPRANINFKGLATRWPTFKTPNRFSVFLLIVVLDHFLLGILSGLPLALTGTP